MPFGGAGSLPEPCGGPAARAPRGCRAGGSMRRDGGRAARQLQCRRRYRGCRAPLAPGSTECEARRYALTTTSAPRSAPASLAAEALCAETSKYPAEPHSANSRPAAGSS